MSLQLPNTLIEVVSAVVTNSKTAFFGVLLMEECDLIYEPATPTAATDGKKIVVGDWFLALPLPERVFVLCHEVLHVAYNHIPRASAYRQRGMGMDMKRWDDKRANKAMDYVINDVLVESGIGRMPAIALHRGFHDDAEKTWDNVYMELPEEEGDDDGQGRQPGDPHNGSMDEHLPAQPATPEQEEAMREAVSKALSVAKETGDMPGALERALGELLDPKIPWKQELRQFVSACSGRDELSFRKFNKRKLVTNKMILPARDGFQLDCAVLAIDTSGSISEDELSAFLAETRAIFEDLAPRELWIAWWDTEAALVQIEDLDDIERATPYGGGGTDYRCVPKAIEMHGLEPDCVICFTDGLVGWPSAEAIVWPHLTLSTNPRWPAPFGRTIHLES